MHRKEFHDRDVFHDFLNKIDIVLPLLLSHDSAMGNVTAFAAALKSYYFNNLTADSVLLMNNLTQLVSDTVFIYPHYSEMQQRLIHAKSPQYLCSFEYRGTNSHSWEINTGFIVDSVSVHGDETLYLFPHPSGMYGPHGLKNNNDDWKMVDTLVQIWTSFVINGTPTIADSNGIPIWEPYSSSKNYLRIGSNSNTSLGVGHNLLKGRLQFWEEHNANIL